MCGAVVERHKLESIIVRSRIDKGIGTAHRTGIVTERAVVDAVSQLVVLITSVAQRDKTVGRHIKAVVCPPVIVVRESNRDRTGKSIVGRILHAIRVAEILQTLAARLGPLRCRNLVRAGEDATPACGVLVRRIDECERWRPVEPTLAGKREQCRAIVVSYVVPC